MPGVGPLSSPKAVSGWAATGPGPNESPLSSPARRLAGERGFTLVEVLVAALVLVIGIGAAVAIFVDSGRAGAAAERHTAGVALAQEEVERIQALPYGQVGMTSTSWPTEGGGSGSNPVSNLTEGQFTPSPETGPEPIVAECDPVDGGCQVEPYTETTIGTGPQALDARVYRFVSWRNETCSPLADLDIDIAGTLGQVAEVLRGNILAGLAIRDLRGNTVEIRDALNAGPGSVLGILNSLPNTANSNLNQQISIAKSNIESGLLAVIAPLMTEPLNQFSQLVNQLVPDELIPQLEALANLDVTLDLCAIDLELLERLALLNDVITPLSEDLLSLRAGEDNFQDLVNEFTGVDSVLEDALAEAVQTTQAAQQAVAQCQSMGSLICGLQGLLSSLLSTLVNVVNGLVSTVNNVVTSFQSESGPGIVPRLNQARTDIPANRPDPPPIRYGNSFNVVPIIEHTSGNLLGGTSDLVQYIADTLDMAGVGVTPNHENTKRVSVAVVLDPPGPGGPQEPIWISTVVSDPDAALLGG